MKEFIVNDRRLATVECDLPMFDCPVFKMLFDIKNNEMSLFATTYQHDAGTGIRTETVPNRAQELKSKVMNLCMDCNIRVR